MGGSAPLRDPRRLRRFAPKASAAAPPASATTSHRRPPRRLPSRGIGRRRVGLCVPLRPRSAQRGASRGIGPPLAPLLTAAQVRLSSRCRWSRNPVPCLRVPTAEAPPPHRLHSGGFLRGGPVPRPPSAPAAARPRLPTVRGMRARFQPRPGPPVARFSRARPKCREPVSRPPQPSCYHPASRLKPGAARAAPECRPGCGLDPGWWFVACGTSGSLAAPGLVPPSRPRALLHLKGGREGPPVCALAGLLGACRPPLRYYAGARQLRSGSLPPVGFSPAPPRPAAPAGGSGEREAQRGFAPLTRAPMVVLHSLPAAAPARRRPIIGGPSRLKPGAPARLRGAALVRP